MTEQRARFTALKSTAGKADPVRLRYIESLLDKAEKAEGALASLLETRVGNALEDYRRQIELDSTPAPARRARPDTGLSDLVRQLNEQSADDDDPNQAPLEHTLRQQEMDLAGMIADQVPTGGEPIQPRQEELRAARRFQSAMVRQNADDTVTRALAEIPEECGPLNPQRLATRSLETMRDLSPHYLNRFVSYIDTLFWLESAERGK